MYNIIHRRYSLNIYRDIEKFIRELHSVANYVNIFGTRANVLGGEFNYSGRSVIVLDPTLHIDEVDVPYKSFVEQFKGSIIKRIIKDMGWTITKATNFLASKFMYDDYVYSVMCRVIDEEHPKLILNRNPGTIAG